MPANGDHYKPDGPDNFYSDALVVDDARISSGGDGSSETQSALANLPVSQYISEALRWHAADAFISDSGTDRLGGTASSSSPTSPRSSPRLAARLSLLYPPTAWGELWILYPPGSFLYDHWIAAGLAAIVRNLRPPVPAHCGIRAVWSIRMVNTYGQYVWSIRPIWSPLSTCPVTMAPLHAADFVTMQVLAISMASLLYSVAQSRHGIAHCLRACGRWLWQLRHTSRAVVCGYVAATVGMDVMLELQAAELGLTPDYWHAYLPSQTCLHYCSAADSFSIDQTRQTVFTTKTIQTVMWP